MTVEICHAKRPTHTSDLIARLNQPNIGEKEHAALNEIKARMVQEFTNDSKSLFYWNEVCMLSEVVTEREFEELVYAFSYAITEGAADGRPVNHDLLRCFARCLRQSKHKIPCERARFGSVLTGLNTHLTVTVRANDPQTIYFLLCAVSILLDTMVDIKFSDLDRESLHSPLKKTLEDLAESKEPRIAQAAQYASQALSRVPDNEGPWEEFFRVSGDAIQAAATISGGVAKLDPSQVIDAGPDLIKLLTFFSSVVKGGKEIWDTREDLKQMARAMRDVSERKGWYDALRQTDIFIRAGAYAGLKMVLPTLKCLGKHPFWCGLYSQLEQHWISGQRHREDIEQFVKWTLDEKALTDHWAKSESVRHWIGFIADSLHHPEWKDLVPKRKSRFPSRLTRRTVSKPLLRTIPQEGHAEEVWTASRLFDKALVSCKKARLFYAGTVLAQHYTDDSHSLLHLKRLSGEDVPMSRCYVNLSLIKHGTRNDKDYEPMVSLQKRLQAESPQPATEISLADLFTPKLLRNESFGKPQRILIRGRAGVGKTTLCKKIIYDFLHHDLWASEYEQIVWIPLRKLKNHNSLESFMTDEVFKKVSYGGDLLETLQESWNDPHNTGTLFILDGLDEIVGYQLPGCSLIECFQDLLNRKHVIITSRPHAAFPSGLDAYDVEIETVGFKDSEISSYVDHFIPQDGQRVEIMKFINQNWALKGLMRIPIQLDALCFTWNEASSQQGSLATMSALYLRIETKLWCKDMVRMGITVNGQPLTDHTAARYKTHRQAYRVMKTPIDLVRFMAFFGMHHGITEFTSEVRTRIHDMVGGTTDNDLDHISFLRSSDRSLDYRDQDYYFLHLTFQEYFAAQHFVQSWKQGGCIKTLGRKSARVVEIPATEFLDRNKYDGRYNIMWRFVTGILNVADHDEEEEEPLLKFLGHIASEQVGLLGPHLGLLTHCFSEISEEEASHKLMELWRKLNNQIFRLFLYMLSLGDLWLRGDGAGIQLPDIILLSILKNGTPEHRREVMEFMNKPQSLTPKVCDMVIDTLRSTEDNELVNLAQGIIGKCPDFSDATVIEIIKAGGELISLFFGLGFRPLVSNELLEAAFSFGYPDTSRLLGRQRHLPERVLQGLTAKLSNESVTDRAHAICALQPSSCKKQIFNCIIGELDGPWTTAKEETLLFLSAQPTISPEVLLKTVQNIENMDLKEAQFVMNLLVIHQPLPGVIIDQVWRFLSCARAPFDITSRKMSFEILLHHGSFSEAECLTRFLNCQCKDTFAVHVAVGCGERCFPPDFVIDHVLSVLSRLMSLNGRESSKRDSYLRQCIPYVFPQNSLPDKARDFLERNYATCPELAIEVLRFQTSLPENILDDLISRIHARKELDANDAHLFEPLFRLVSLPDSILEKAAHVLRFRLNPFLLRLFLSQSTLSSNILTSFLASSLLSQEVPYNSRDAGELIEDILVKHPGLDIFLTQSGPDQWVNLFRFLLGASFRGHVLCFIYQDHLHIKIKERSVQINIEGDEQRRKLQIALDSVQQIIQDGVDAYSKQSGSLPSLV